MHQKYDVSSRSLFESSLCSGNYTCMGQILYSIFREPAALQGNVRAQRGLPARPKSKQALQGF